MSKMPLLVTKYSFTIGILLVTENDQAWFLIESLLLLWLYTFSNFIMSSCILPSNSVLSLLFGRDLIKRTDIYIFMNYCMNVAQEKCICSWICMISVLNDECLGFVECCNQCAALFCSGTIVSESKTGECMWLKRHLV